MFRQIESRHRFQRFGEREAEVGYRIELSNDKPESVVVSLEEQLTGDWTIISESQEGTRRDGTTYVFELQVPSEGSAAAGVLGSFQVVERQ